MRSIYLFHETSLGIVELTEIHFVKVANSNVYRRKNLGLCSFLAQQQTNHKDN